MFEAAQLRRFCPVKGNKRVFFKKRKEKRKAKRGTPELQRRTGVALAAGSSFRCSVPISQREFVASEAALCFLFLLLRTKCSGWWLRFKDGGPDDLRMVNRTPSRELLRSDRTARGDADE